MYIGSTGQRGLHHLIYEILDNAVDEMQAGAARQAWVELDLPSGWVRVRDDGRGIPTALHPTTGVSALETVLTVLHAGGKFGGQASGYGVSGGLHGVGLSVVNALSAALEVEVWREGRSLGQGAQSMQHGTEVRFRFDPAIFSSGAEFDPETVRGRLRETAFINAGAAIHFRVG
ncbi:hypothetical protein H632_c1624p1, partial [Helicosporidium sp. ATCC 50920]